MHVAAAHCQQNDRGRGWAKSVVGCSIKEIMKCQCASLAILLGQERIYQGKAVRHAPHKQVCSLL